MEQLNLFNSFSSVVKPEEATPTYIIDFYDKQERRRHAWYDAASEAVAIELLKKEYGKSVQIVDISLSARSCEELNNL